MRFSELSADPAIKLKLIRTVQDQRVSHAQLFYGPEGSGKLALAIAYAQLINCSTPALPRWGDGEGGGADSCGACPSCVQFRKLVHPDMHFFFPTSTTREVTSRPSSKYFLEAWRKYLLEINYRVSLSGWYEAIGIENRQGTIYADDANEINRILSYKSYESEFKIILIWMVEKVYSTAVPKILKVLEEPPEKTLFLLITDNPEQVIPTLVSRCLPVRIPRYRPAESPVLPEEDKLHFEMFRAWMRLCFSRNIPDLIGFATEAGKLGREKQKSLLRYGLSLSRNVLARRYGLTQGPVTGEEETEFISRFSPVLEEAKLLPFYNLLNSSVFHIERNAHAPTLFLDLSLKLTGLLKG